MSANRPDLFNTPTSQMALRGYLEDLGYRIFERVDGWSECLLVGHGESWLGRGGTALEAFEAACRAGFPSVAAQTALATAVENHSLPAQEVEAEAAQRPLPDSLTLATVPTAATAATAVATAVIAALDPETPHEEPGEPSHVSEAESRPADDATGMELHPGLDVASREALSHASDSHLAVVHRADKASPPLLPMLGSPVLEETGYIPPSLPDETQIQLELDDLNHCIERQKADLAVCSPHRQRLVLLGWLSRARALQDEYPRSIPVAVGVGRMVKVLRNLSEAWWPGMVSAFQIRARPMDSSRDLRPFVDLVPMSWNEVAEAADAALRLVEEQDEQDGRDADGWADVGQLIPPPPFPDTMLAELEAEIEEQAPLETRQPKDGSRPSAERLEIWSRRLRWLRQDPSDPAAWGRLAGRLRYWAQGAPIEVRQLLDPAFRPGRSWATLVRSADELARDELELANLLEATPLPDASDERILEWIAAALPLGAFNQALLLEAAAPIRERILSFDEQLLPASDRRSRRRLQKVLDALRADGEAEGEAGEDPLVAAPVDEDHPIPNGEVETPAPLLEKTRGRRVLFVSNRSDGMLQERLQSAFEFAQLDWAEATPRRVEAATEAIASGTYDLVLGATGFLSHKEDGRLQKVCKSVGVPYVRTNRGRPGAVQLALARDLLGLASLDDLHEGARSSP